MAMGFASAARASLYHARTKKRLIWLTLTRLVLSLMSFGAVISLDSFGLELTASVRAGLYWTAAFAIFATVVSGLGFRKARKPERFAVLQVITDVVIVTSLVHFSGGRDSIFTFLYAVVPVYGAVLFGWPGALGASLLSALAYGLALIANSAGWLGSFGESPEALPLAVLATIWGVHVVALFMVSALASALAGDLSRAGEALIRRTDDLLQLQDLHQRTVESVMSGLLTTDQADVITSFNPEAERIIAASASEVLGSKLDEVIPGIRDLGVESVPAAAGAQVRRARLRVRNRSGEELYLGVASSVLKDATGRPAGRVVIFQDVTKVVEMERNLRRSERLAAVGEMGAKIAHEIRNPLAAISGSIQLLHRQSAEVAPDSEAGRLMDIVEREADRLNRLLTDFLRYARPTPPQLSPVEVTRLVKDVVAILAVACPEEIEIVTDRMQPIWLLADAEQMRQVMWNLLQNGIQAMPGGGQLEVRADCIPVGCVQDTSGSHRNPSQASDSTDSGGWAEISVIDGGVGISQEAQERMFEPFFTTRRDGTGLGLATVHRILEAHGGQLVLQSELGQGTTVRLRLPVVEAPA